MAQVPTLTFSLLTLPRMRGREGWGLRARGNAPGADRQVPLDRLPPLVIPAKAGIHGRMDLGLRLAKAGIHSAASRAVRKWVPACAGMTIR